MNWHGGIFFSLLSSERTVVEALTPSFQFVHDPICRGVSACQTSRTQRSLRLDELGVVGEKIEEDTRNLVDLLTNKEKNVNVHKKVMVYAIVGVGGIGKTTLAKKIFNHDFIKQEFEKRIWLSVNQ
jgi:signal recognition particle GTPase